MTDPPSAKPDSPTRIEAEREGSHVAILVDGDRRFTVRTGDLADIAAQVRGKKQFSVFNSIILPILISVLTVVGTTLVGQTMQYVSWRNSTRLQLATDQATRATAAYDKASMAIGERYYGTTLFLGAVRDLANRKEDVESHLYKLDLALLQRRYDGFYAQLKKWNETYDQMLSDIDYHLDRPVPGVAAQVRKAAFRQLNCLGSLISELDRLHLAKDSLKMQFAVLNWCFGRTLDSVREEKNKAVVDKDYRFNAAVSQKADDLNDNIQSMSNEFRCYAQNRIAYFEGQKDKAVFKLSTWASDRLDRALGRAEDPAAIHVERTRKACALG